MAKSVGSWVKEEVENRKSEWYRSHEKSSSQAKRIRELNKRFKTISDEFGEEYGPDVDETLIAERAKVATSIRQRNIIEVFRRIRQSQNVELCFLVDATGSMQRHIDEVKDTIQDIVKKLTDVPDLPAKSKVHFAAQDLKIAFVAYRDHKDEPQFEIFNFSKSTDDFKKFCASLKATGGADDAEDVFGGLEKAIMLNWSDDVGTKVIFHICDAPCHGKEFHEGAVGDSYPDGDPNGRSHKELFGLIRERGIQYHFGKIGHSTDRMIYKFSEAYGEKIVTFDVSEIKNIRDSVIKSVTTSIFTSVNASKSIPGRKERPFTFVLDEPDWDDLPTIKGKFLTYELPESIEDIVKDVPLNRRKPNMAEVKMAPNPFAKGAERVAYFGVDVSPEIEMDSLYSLPPVPRPKDKKIVLKEYLHEGKGANSYRKFEIANQLQTVASYLAAKFSEEVKKKCGYAESIKFVKIRTFQFYDKEGNEKFFSCERKFSNEAKFIRFTNNTTYELLAEKAKEIGVQEVFIQLVVAFSHWTYKATDRHLMVVDLEGVISPGDFGEVNIVLTDPAIHCKDVTQFGSMNHGPKGMEGFFSVHTCNSFCEALGIDKFKPK